MGLLTRLMTPLMTPLIARFGTRALIRCAGMVCLLVLARQVPAQVPELTSAYPKGSIDSPEKAEAALKAVQLARERSDVEFRDDQRRCYKKILVTACLTQINEAKRARVTDIDAVQLEAKAFKRQYQGDKSANERQQKADDKAANATEDAAHRAQSRTDYEARQAEAARKAQDRDNVGMFVV